MTSDEHVEVLSRYNNFFDDGRRIIIDIHRPYQIPDWMFVSLENFDFSPIRKPGKSKRSTDRVGTRTEIPTLIV